MDLQEKSYAALIDFFFKSTNLSDIQKTKKEIEGEFRKLSVEQIFRGLFFSEDVLIVDMLTNFMHNNKEWDKKKDEMRTLLEKEMSNFINRNTLLQMKLFYSYLSFEFPDIKNQDLFDYLISENSWYFRKIALLSLDLAIQETQTLVQVLVTVILTDSDFCNRIIALEQLIKINTKEAVDFLQELSSGDILGRLQPMLSLNGKSYREIFLDIVPYSTHESLKSEENWRDINPDVVEKREKEIEELLLRLLLVKFNQCYIEINKNPLKEYRRLALKKMPSKEKDQLTMREREIVGYLESIKNLQEHDTFDESSFLSLEPKESIPDLLCMIIERKVSEIALIQIIKLLSKLQVSDVIPFLIRILESDYSYYLQPPFTQDRLYKWSESVLLVVIETLRILRIKEATPVLKALFYQVHETMLEREIGLALVNIGTDEALEALVEEISNIEKGKRDRYLRHYSELQPPTVEERSIVPVWEAIGVPERYNQGMREYSKSNRIVIITNLLVEFGDKAIPHYIRLTNKKFDTLINKVAIKKLARLQAKDAIPRLKEIVDDRMSSSRKEAKETLLELGRINTEDIITPFQNYLFGNSVFKPKEIVNYWIDNEIIVKDACSDLYSELEKNKQAFHEIWKAFQNQTIPGIIPKLKLLMKETKYPRIRFLAFKYAGAIDLDSIFDYFEYGEDNLDDLDDLVLAEEDQVIQILISCILYHYDHFFYDYYGFGEYLGEKALILKEEKHSDLLIPIMLNLMLDDIVSSNRTSNIGPRAIEVLAAINAKDSEIELCKTYKKAYGWGVYDESGRGGYDEEVDDYTWVRVEIIRALTKIGVEPRNKIFLEALDDPYCPVAYEALKGIIKHQMKFAIPDLLERHFSYDYRECGSEYCDLIKEALIQLKVPFDSKIPHLAFSLELDYDFLSRLVKDGDDINEESEWIVPPLTNEEIIELFQFLVIDLQKYIKYKVKLQDEKIIEVFVRFFHGKELIPQLECFCKSIDNPNQKKIAELFIQSIKDFEL